LPRRDALGLIAVAAGRAVLDRYEEGCGCSWKKDGSPVTHADVESEAIVSEGLANIYPDVPVVAEEAAAAGFVPQCGATFLLVDPLDGTREFLDRNGEFTVNIALIEHGAPVCGAVYAPALGLLWLGDVSEGIAESMVVAPAAPALPGERQRHRLACRATPDGGMVALVSRSHLDPASEAFLGTLPVAERRVAGSSLKFCRIAAGEGDVYPRFAPTMEWDTAAGQAVLVAAGGAVTTPEGVAFRYGKPDFRNGPFVAWGRRTAL
jgi:3'(2'), 5'-bisphosphate nucleotidase